MNLKAFLFCLLQWSVVYFSSAQIVIERSEDLDIQDIKSKKLMVLMPEMDFIFGKAEVEKDYLKSSEFAGFVNITIEKAAKANGFTVEIISANGLVESDMSFFTDFVSLKQNIFQTNNLQNHPFNKSGVEDNSVQKIYTTVFVEPPRILPEYSYLAQKYKTPYFALMGWININTKDLKDAIRIPYSFRYNSRYSVLYFIIVNVEKARIEYREFKITPFMFMKVNAYSVLYDSYFYLNNLNYESK